MKRIVKVRWRSQGDFIEALKYISKAVSDSEVKNEMLKKQLEQFPNGLQLTREQARSCKICNQTAWGDNSWYDEFGVKCMSCQEAVNSMVIPPELSKVDFYTFYELDEYFSVSEKKARQWIKQAIVKTRTIMGRGSKSKLYLFLMADNEHFFPPKEMLKSKRIRLEPKNDEPYDTFLPWYHYCDVLDYLKDYGIVHHLGN